MECDSCKNKNICMYADDYKQLRIQMKAVGEKFNIDVFRITLACAYYLEDKQPKSVFTYTLTESHAPYWNKLVKGPQGV